VYNLIQKLLTYISLRWRGSVRGANLLVPFATEPNHSEMSNPQLSIYGRKQVYNKTLLSISNIVTHTNDRRTPMRSVMEQASPTFSLHLIFSLTLCTWHYTRELLIHFLQQHLPNGVLCFVSYGCKHKNCIGMQKLTWEWLTGCMY
jgi:hypothetical protein